MNLILLDSLSQECFLPLEDPRAIHILEVLKMVSGDELFVGALNGPRGKATLLDTSKNGVSLRIVWDNSVDPLLPINLILGTPRPQTARKILQEGTSFGVQAFHFFKPEKGESAYAQSKLWQTDEWQRHLRLGAEQSFTTFIPKVFHHESLEALLGSVDLGGSTRIALDNYEATSGLTAALNLADKYSIALGAERGWSTKERELLRESGFKLAHLSERVFRMETACAGALALVSSALGRL